MHEERIESGIKSAAESTQDGLLAMSGDINRIVDKIVGQIETKGGHTSRVANDASEEQERLDAQTETSIASITDRRSDIDTLSYEFIGTQFRSLAW
jgi:hypothetical protein